MGGVRCPTTQPILRVVEAVHVGQERESGILQDAPEGHHGGGEVI